MATDKKQAKKAANSLLQLGNSAEVIAQLEEDYDFFWGWCEGTRTSPEMVHGDTCCVPNVFLMCCYWCEGTRIERGVGFR